MSDEAAPEWCSLFTDSLREDAVDLIATGQLLVLITSTASTLNTVVNLVLD